MPNNADYPEQAFRRVMEDLNDLIKDLLDYKRDEDSVHIAALLLDIRDGTYVSHR